MRDKGKKMEKDGKSDGESGKGERFGVRSRFILRRQLKAGGRFNC